MMLTKATEYAIRALVYIKLQNTANKRPGVIEIAEEIEVPRPFTAKILQMLVKQDLLKSLKGRGGGFYFSDGQEKVSLLTVIKRMEGDQLFYRCGIGLKNCNDGHPCPLHEKYTEIRSSFLKLVQEETIQSLAEKILEGKAVLNS